MNKLLTVTRVDNRHNNYNYLQEHQIQTQLLFVKHLVILSRIDLLFSFFLCLQGLKSLCFLSLDSTKVTDAGMVLYLQSAPSCLSQLSLNQTAVTEATLAVLPSCVPQLRLLSIKQTKVLQLAIIKLLFFFNGVWWKETLQRILVKQDQDKTSNSHCSLCHGSRHLHNNQFKRRGHNTE